MTNEEKDVNFAVTATGPADDHLTYQWVKEKGGLMSNVTDEQYTPNLTIQAVKPSDSGLYYCTIKSKWNATKKSNLAFLKVICKSCTLNDALSFYTHTCTVCTHTCTHTHMHSYFLLQGSYRLCICYAQRKEKDIFLRFEMVLAIINTIITIFHSKFTRMNSEIMSLNQYTDNINCV